MEDYIASLQREIREETIEETTKKVSRETAERVSKETVHAIYQDNVPVHKIASYLRKDTKTIEACLGLNPQK